MGDWGSKERLFCICIGSSFASEWSEHGVLALGVRDSMGMRVIVDFLLVAFFLKQEPIPGVGDDLSDASGPRFGLKL